MPRSLAARLVAAFAVLSLIVVLVVGAALFVVLRGLHADATLGSLADVAGSVLPQVRDSLGNGELRGAVAEVRDQLADRDITVMLIGADGRLRPIGGLPTAASVAGADLAAGETTRGEVVVDGQRYLYVATGLRRVAGANPRAIAFLAPDRSGAQAVVDLGRAIPVVFLVVLLIATPLALLVARSVTRPLRRLGHATTAVPAGAATPLPLEGPQEVRELTGTFNAMAVELEAGRRREAELLANLRHDLRTPLTVIAGYAAALGDGTARGTDAEAAARAIAEEAARLERLVTEVGAVERIRSGEESIRPELLDGGQLVADTVARFAASATAVGASLTAAPAPAAVTLTLAADRVALERMLGNLVDNAIGAVARSDGAGAVVVEAAPDVLPGGVEAVRFDVIDDGEGFPDGSADRAFERFWRGDAARAGSGSGLGLAIVRELAVAHGGAVHAGNRPPRGARVGFTLPRVPWPPTRPPAGGAAR